MRSAALGPSSNKSPWVLHELAPRHPAAFGHLLQALHWYLSPARPIACAVPART